MTRRGLLNAPSPPSRRGHYSDDGRSWYDESRGRVYPLLDGADSLLVELQEIVVTSAEAPEQQTATYRFIGRARSLDVRWPEYAVVGGAFRGPRALLSGAAPPQECWTSEMAARLAELRAALTAEGWLLAGRDDRPWAYRYTRPWVDLRR